MNAAETPFEFVTVSYLTRIGTRARHAWRVSCGRRCSDASIFTTRFKRCASLSLTKDFPTTSRSGRWRTPIATTSPKARRARHSRLRFIAALRTSTGLRATIAPRFRIFGKPRWSVLFLQSMEVTAPLGRSARTLDEFRSGVRTSATRALLSLHLFEARLQLRTNDFSHWLAEGLGLGTLANSVDHIDIYTNTWTARAKLLRLIDRESKER